MPQFKHAVVITGSIGSGKSAVCELLRDRGFEIIDADKISHRVLDRCAAQVAEIFGVQYVVQKNARVKFANLSHRDLHRKNVKLKNVRRDSAFAPR